MSPDYPVNTSLTHALLLLFTLTYFLFSTLCLPDFHRMISFFLSPLSALEYQVHKVKDFVVLFCSPMDPIDLIQSGTLQVPNKSSLDVEGLKFWGCFAYTLIELSSSGVYM